LTLEDPRSNRRRRRLYTHYALRPGHPPATRHCIVDVGCGAVGRRRQRRDRAAAITRARILAKDGELIVRRDRRRRDVPREPNQKTIVLPTRFDKEDLVRSNLDDQAQAFLSDQRQQLAVVTTIGGLDMWRDNLVAANRQRGGAVDCVLATMVSQLADRDEHNRVQVAGYFAEWRRLVATTLRRMQTGGQLRRDAAPDELATGLIAALQGGYVLAQASRNVDHMATAIEMALARIRFFAAHR
jgi:TetR/AcrR family transcriptional regulator, transcriptional repressor for nem operon